MIPRAAQLSGREGPPGPAPTPALFVESRGLLSTMPVRRARLGGALGVSLAVHVLAVVLTVVVTAMLPEGRSEPIRPSPINYDVVWLSQPGPGGGGGGGGNRMPEPPRKVELPGRDKLSVPAAKKPDLVRPQPEPEVRPPEQKVTIPAESMASAEQIRPGVLENLPGTAISQGPGVGGGAGTGTGTGIGPGEGSGLGPGYGGGTGGGVYRPGAGIELPRLIYEKKPSYTAEAMRAKVQGVVELEAVVLPDGTVGEIRVTRSLDRAFGLDQEAIKAVKQWRFEPGTRFGKPVPVLVTIELTFTLR
ncbi:MAG TPA: TonB family protein [Vicinamibacterales bacterium]|nr:TonB family protein [Vicinamibacterales bacterium]